MIIHITGASGSGTSTLAQSMAESLNLHWLDTDNFFWLPTEPPYTIKQEMPARLLSMIAEINQHSNCVISGSLCGWGDPLIEMFDLIIYLETPSDIRLTRLVNRETERYGDKIKPHGDYYDHSQQFLEWAMQYDDGNIHIRSKAMHEAWLKQCPCKILRLDGTRSTTDNIAIIKTDSCL